MQTEAHSPHETPGRALGPRRVVVYRGLLVSRLEFYFGRKEVYIQKQIMLKSQCNRSYGSLGI